MALRSINLRQKLRMFTGFWSPKVISEMNDYQFKVVKAKGEFVWHSHHETDEVIIVLEGSLTICFRDGNVDIGEGEMFVVKKGLEHKPIAESECHLLIIEPRGVINTGNAASELRAENDVWI